MSGPAAAVGGITVYGVAVAGTWLAAALGMLLAAVLETPWAVFVSMALGAAALLALVPWSIGTHELTSDAPP